MFEQATLYILHYGYIAIFLLVFMQEVGLPNPLPNELLLLFTGYLAFIGKLNFFYVFLSAMIGDIAGGVIQYTAFYFFGELIIKRKPKWVPLSTKKIEEVSTKINTSGQIGLFIGRLTPFIKGYVSVISGLMHFSPMKFVIVLLSSSIIWSLMYTVGGYLLAPYWSLVEQETTSLKYWIIIFSLIPVLIIALVQAYKQFLKTKKV